MTSKKRLILTMYVLSFIILLAVYLTGRLYDIPYKNITGDPAYVSETNPFTGVISNLGVILWASTAAVCLFAGLILRRIKLTEDSLFFWSSGLITMVLLVDDLFMLHDYVFLKYLGIKQIITYGIYGLIVGWYCLKFRSTILKSSRALFVIALTFFAASVLCDIFFKEGNLQYFWEDSFKFIGIVSWSLFFLTRVSQSMKTQLENNASN